MGKKKYVNDFILDCALNFTAKISKKIANLKFCSIKNQKSLITSTPGILMGF